MPWAFKAGSRQQKTHTHTHKTYTQHCHFNYLQARDWYRQDLIPAAIKKTGKPRESLFLVSKVVSRLIYNRYKCTVGLQRRLR